MPKTFQTIGSVTTKGYLQAVSQDGRVCVYMTEKFLHIYYFDGEEVRSRSVEMGGVHVRKVEENYHEEATPFHHILARMVGDKIVVFMLEITRREIIRVELGDYGRSMPEFKSQGFNFDVLDMAFHPTGDCLLVLTDKYIVFVLKGDGGAEQQMIMNLETDITIVNAKLVVLHQHQQVSLYAFYMQLRDGQEELKVYFLEEKVYLSNYWQRASATIVYDNVVPYDHLVGVDYQDGVFALVRDHIDVENERRKRLLTYMTDELQVLTSTNEVQVTTDFFHSFVSGEKAMLMGNYDNFPGNILDLYLNETCYLPYESSSQQVYFQPEKEKCLEGYYDRVSSWVLDGETYLVTHTDHQLKFYDSAFRQQLDTLSAYTFSTKVDDLLILDTYGQLKYLQWREVEQPQLQPQTQPEPSDNLLVGVIVMGVCLLIMLIIICVLCVKMRGTSAPEDAPPDSSTNVINPYLHPPSKHNPSSQSKPSTELVLAGQKQSN